jgi:hypothetical protein
MALLGVARVPVVLVVPGHRDATPPTMWVPVGKPFMFIAAGARASSGARMIS